MSDLYNNIKSRKFIIAGPCVLEDYDKSLMMAKFASKVCDKYGFTYIFKASFDKANRTSVDSYRGVGIEKGREILKEINKDFYTLTDIHTPSHADIISDSVDIIQIPAFLCRQTDLLTAAGRTNKIVNIKKFQLLSGIDMIRPIEKVLSVGNEKIMLTERGTLIPYGNVIVDLRNIVDMVKLGYPVVMDCTHACQSLNQGQTKTSGRKEMASIYAQSAMMCGVSGYFTEIYKNPNDALSDSSTSLDFNQFQELVSGVGKLMEKK
tara:strand:- start:5738 stop:6529 length:792 start_codon:yes stop_codon:yes gene_type:complete